MIKSYVFRCADAASAFRARLQSAGKDGMTVEVAGSTVKIARKHAMPLLSGFSPVFVGRIGEHGAGAELRGRFRFHLAAIFLIAGFLGLSVYYLLQLLLMTQVPSDYPPDWKSNRIWFELQFLGFSALAIFMAWLAGKPMRQRIAEFIEHNCRPAAGKG